MIRTMIEGIEHTNPTEYRLLLQRKHRDKRGTAVVQLGTIQRNPRTDRGSDLAWRWVPSQSFLEQWLSNPWDAQEPVTRSTAHAVQLEIEAKLWIALIGDSYWTNLDDDGNVIPPKAPNTDAEYEQTPALPVRLARAALAILDAPSLDEARALWLDVEKNTHEELGYALDGSQAPRPTSIAYACCAKAWQIKLDRHRTGPHGYDKIEIGKIRLTLSTPSFNE